MKFLYEVGQELSTFLSIRLFAIHGVEITVGGIGAFLLSVVLAVLVGRVSNRALIRMLTRRGIGVADQGTSYALGRILQYAVTLIGVLIGLENVGFSFTTLAALGAVFAVGLGFGLQNIAQNFISGLILLLERPIKKGDVVLVQGSYGIVDEISIRATRIMTFDEVALIVPNSKFISDVVENRSEPTARCRTRIGVRVAHGSDTRLVERTLMDLAKAHAQVLQEPEPLVLFTDFAESSLDFQLSIWVGDAISGGQVASDLRHAIVVAFENAGLRIPFPQRDVRMKQSAA